MRKNRLRIPENWWIMALILLIAGCQNEADKTNTQAINQFDDQVLIHIYDLQDRRDTDSLLKYFDHENPLYRATAAEAFGSVQDSLAIPMLAILLNDESAKVRKAAAYALGQTYDSAAMEPLAGAISHEDSVFVRRELFEALGKVITQPKLAWLNTRPVETDLDKEGLAWGLYRAGIRNVHDDLSTGMAVNLLNRQYSYSTRLGAAHYLARSRNIELTQYLPKIIEAATTDSAVDVRMAATAALGKISLPRAIEVLATSCLKDSDYRVRINALRALSAYNSPKVLDSFYESLADSNVNVAITAAGNINRSGKDVERMLAAAEEGSSIRVKATLYGGALRLSTDKQKINDLIRKEYVASQNPYYKAQLLEAMAEDIKNYEFIVTETFNTEEKVISTSGTIALSDIRGKEGFPKELEKEFAEIFKELMITGDVAIVSILSGVLANPDYKYPIMYEDSSFLYTAKSKLSLPKDNEALQVLNKTIALFEGKETFPETHNEFNHPIDWELVKSIPQNQQVAIHTVKGKIVLRLLVNEAPGTVANFYSLATSGYFNGKNFHRVVPNFVVQGGCNRGDGYGGEDYSIRSELPNLQYKTGSIGMASAGKDTEGTQWFITHSPTPHLDGRYTIFAQAEEGMEIVHQMEMGDKILSVELL